MLITSEVLSASLGYPKGFRFRPMRMTRGRFRATTALVLFVGLGILGPSPISGQGTEPVVHAILFYSPTCPHCHELINNHLIPLQQQYGRRFVILAFDVTQGWANELYYGAVRHYEVPQEDWVVPIMVVEEEVLVGGDVIPVRLTQYLEEGLAGDGVDLPNFPPLLSLLEEEGMLDLRHPDRRVVLQSAPEAEEPTGQPDEPQEEGVTGADSTREAGADPTGQDTAAADPQPTLPEEPAGEEEAQPDSATVVAPGVEEGAEVPAPSPEPTEATTDAVPEPVPSAGASPTEEAPETGTVPGKADTARGTPVQPPPEGASTAPREPGGTRPLDLAGAVEEMESMTMMDRFNQDRTGNFLSVLVLLGMVVSLILRGFPARASLKEWPAWVVPALVVLGIGVAGYLSFIEVTHSEAVCGPVGDCNTVNQSEYATLFGFLPVGVLGLVGYALILTFWILGRFGPGEMRGSANLGLWMAALLGTLFSAYLTFLEPFVIGATCAWCLGSAIIMTLLLWATAPLAARAWPGAPGEAD